MIIGFDAYTAMIDHMRLAAPLEGVGLLAGPKGHLDHIPYELRSDVPRVDRWVPLVNTAEHPRLRFQVDPAEQIAAYEACEADGLWPWVMVHSHVRASAAPSETDIRYATDPNLLHMIVSLASSAPVAVLWRLDPNAAAPDRAKKIHYQVVDLGFRANPATDLTHGVSGA